MADSLLPGFTAFLLVLSLALATPRLAFCQVQKLAPCNAATELTCAGVPGFSGPSICCNTMNFGCSVRTDTGAPRCAMCPSFCPDCAPGFKCGKDANGCKTCVVDEDPANSMPGYLRTCHPTCKAGLTCHMGVGNVRPVCVPTPRVEPAVAVVPPVFGAKCRPVCKAGQACRPGKAGAKPVCVRLVKRNRRQLAA